MIEIIKMAVSTFLTIKSGYLGLQGRTATSGYEWVDVDDPSFGGCDPYYLCGKFRNGRRIPLPILCNWRKERTLQQFAVVLAGRCINACLDADSLSLIPYDHWSRA